MPAIISTHGVTKYYDNDRIKALNGVDLEIEAGEFVAIVGPSGSGKSTLLHMLGALDKPTSGSVVVDGRDLSSVRDLATFRRKTVGFVFQLHNLIPSLTAWENVQIPLMEGPLSSAERKQRALGLLADLGLGGRAENLPTELSGGERQRVAIARALANDPRVLIADEPTGAVDSANSARILELLQQIAEERDMTLVVVTHDPSVAAKADRTITILDGAIAGAA